MRDEPRRSPNKTNTLTDEMSDLEVYFDKRFGEGSSVQLSPGRRRFLVKIAPWLTLLSAVLIIFFIRTYWQIGMERYENARQLVEHASQFSQMGIIWYLVLFILCLQVVMLVLALPGTLKRRLSGWRKLFYVALTTLLLGALYLFIPGYGFPNVIGSLVLAGASLLALMQTRSYFRA